MNTDMFLSWQFGATLLIVLALGIWQLMRVRRSQTKRGEDPGSVTTTGVKPAERSH